MIRRDRNLLALWSVTVLFLLAMFACVIVAACSSSSTSPAKTAAREAEFCAARATYKLAAAAAGGALDPAPGSPRAKLEAAEDAFCETHTDGGQ